MPTRPGDTTAAAMLGTWTDSDTAMQIVGTSLGIFGPDLLDPEVALTDDGRWSFAPNTTAAYRTRVIVRRPVNAAQASGTVIVEWLNVPATACCFVCSKPPFSS